MHKYIFFIVIFSIPPFIGSFYRFTDIFGPLENKYGYFSDRERLEMLEETRKMFTFGYDNYMKHAFLQDELNPVLCSGRGPDHENP